MGGKKSLSFVRRVFRKTKGELVPGTLIKCKSGRYMAFYEHRTDIIANGENAVDARKNLRELYETVIAHETEEGLTHEDDDTLIVPEHFSKTSFREKLYA